MELLWLRQPKGGVLIPKPSSPWLHYCCYKDAAT